MPANERKSHGCLWATLIMIALVTGAGVLLVLGLLTAGNVFQMPMPAGMRDFGADEFPDMREVWAYGGGDAKVVTIPLKGMIVLDEDGGFFASVAGSAGAALRSIQRATRDDKVDGIILDIDSGGGGITACDILYNALLEFKDARDGRKVVACFGDVAASGAYYVALAADHIVAHPTTLTGSIGVLLQTFNVRKLGEKVGVEDVTIKSGANKDILNPFGQLSEDQRGMLQGIVDSMHERFASLVAEGRGLPMDKVREIADGRVFVSARAMEHGLLDEIGYWEDAVAAAAMLLHVDDVRVYRYEKGFSISELIRSWNSLHPKAILREFASTRLLYLWQP